MSTKKIRSEAGKHKLPKSPNRPKNKANVKIGRRALNSKLVKELRRLMYLLGIEENLQVCWIPKLNRDVDGEVRDGIVYIYAEDEKQAIEVLRHELVDYLLTARLVKPLVDLINILIKYREGEIYREKESLVKAFCRFLEAAEA
ncbi:MAG: hypothetical protein QXV01_12035 [Candidatus Bathyarchaeia archaeon]